jgi:hypothetical protein
VIREADALALLDELLGLDRSGADVQDALDVAAH